MRFCYTCLMYYIVGLGNPGKEYEETRHNVGFLFVQHFVKEAQLPDFHESKTLNGLITQGIFEGEEVTVFLPHTYMNASGSAIARLVPKNESHKLIVVYDEVDLPLGEAKVSFGRGDGGHNGIRSIIDKLGTKDFVRLRVGIAVRSIWTGKTVRPKGEALGKFVLKRFSPKEEKQLHAQMERMQDMIAVFVKKGKDALMNVYN